MIFKIMILNQNIKKMVKIERPLFKKNEN